MIAFIIRFLQTIVIHFIYFLAWQVCVCFLFGMTSRFCLFTFSCVFSFLHVAMVHKVALMQSLQVVIHFSGCIVALFIIRLLRPHLVTLPNFISQFLILDFIKNVFFGVNSRMKKTFGKKHQRMYSLEFLEVIPVW